MNRAWLLKRAVYLAVLALAAASLVVLLALGWSDVAAILNGGWPAWVNNLASISQIALVLVALVSWFVAKVKRTGIVKSGDGGAAWLLAFLALLLPGRDRERFVSEVRGNLAYSLRWWERAKELLSVARAVPGLAAMLWRARGQRIYEERNSCVAEAGSTIEVEDEDGETITFHLVGAAEADPVAGNISVESPVGRALVGKRTGERVSVQVPAGTVELTITTVS